MKGLLIALCVLATAASGCKKKAGDATGGSGSGSAVVDVGSGSGSAAGSGSAPPVADGPKCPPGNVLEAGACKPAITAEKVEAIGAQQTRLDELATLLDKAETVAAPVELLSAITTLEEWKKLTASSDKFKAVEGVIVILTEAVKQLHALQAGVKDGAVRLGNIKGELDAIMKDTGAAKKIEEVRAVISKEVHAAVDTLTKEVVATIQKVIIPLKTQLADVSDLVIGGCVLAKQSGGEKVKDLCAKAKDIFRTAERFIEDFEKKPEEMIKALVTSLETQLGDLVDAEEKKLMAAAQAAVNEALRLPTGAGSGAGSGSGSGSAAP